MDVKSSTSAQLAEALRQANARIATLEAMTQRPGLAQTQEDDWAENALRTVAANVADATGLDFFQSLVQHLALAFGVRHVFVGVLDENRPEVVRTLAVWADGPADNVEYELAGTPCAKVVEQRTCVYQQGVQALFPEDTLLVEMNVESYFGTPMIGATGKSLGVLAMLDDKPMSEPDERARSLLTIFATRAAAEVERLRVEATLRRSEERYRLLAENTMNVIWTADLTLRFTYVSPAVFELTGYTAEEVTAESFGPIVAPQYCEEVTQRFVRQVELAQQDTPTAWEPIVVETQQMCRDGTLIFTETTAQILKTDDGKPASILGTTHDISDRKRAEQEHANLREQLYQSRKMDAIGRLAGGVAHEFNNMLCAITGNAMIVLDELPAGGSLHESIEEVAKAAERAAQLTSQLLSFARKQTVNPMELELTQLITQLQPIIGRIVGQDIVVSTKSDGRPHRIYADANQIKQAVLNLAINAHDAMPDGGNLVFETADGNGDDVYFDDHPNCAKLTIRDDGCGMSKEVCDKVFEPFFSTKERTSGTGLGLAMVFGVVQQANGHIDVQSTPNEGTLFSLYFPRPASEATVESQPTKPVGGREEVVLVVEDEPMVRNMAVKVIERLGYQVLAAESGQQALTLSQQHHGPIHLMLTDVIMPHMNGRELATQMGRLRPDTKVLFTSGYSEDIIGSDVLDTMAEFIAKPYTVDALAAQIRKALDSHNPN